MNTVFYLNNRSENNNAKVLHKLVESNYLQTNGLEIQVDAEVEFKEKFNVSKNSKETLTNLSHILNHRDFNSTFVV